MGAKSRNKGKRGELEAIHALEGLLGVTLAREHGQSAFGGHDCTIPLDGGMAVLSLEALARLLLDRGAGANHG